MSINHTENLLELVQEKQLSQFKDLTNWERMLSLFSGFLQEAESNVYDLVISRMLDDATDAQLDQWGAVVGEGREGELDDPYRNIIKARIRANLCSGTIEDLLVIVQTLSNRYEIGGESFFGFDMETRVVEQYPCRITISFCTAYPLSESTRQRMKRMVELARPAGVSLSGIVECRLEYFGFGDDPDAAGFMYGEFGSLIT